MMTPEEHALLSNLVYNDDVHEKLAEWLASSTGASANQSRQSTIGDYLKGRMGDDGSAVSHGGSTYTTQREWEAIVSKTLESPIANMQVVDVSQNSVDQGWMLTLKNPSTHEAVIVYQGTASGEGWVEDVKAGGVVLTASQQEAIDYANSMTSKLADYRISVTGHSKGGNEAALAAIACDGVDVSYPFDAPGFSEAFFTSKEFSSRIATNSRKVHYYNYELDYVSALLKPLPADTHLLTSDLDVWHNSGSPDGMLKLPLRAHSPVMLFGSDYLYGNGSFTETLGEGASYRGELLKFSMFASSALPDADTEALMSFISTFVAGVVSPTDSDGDGKEDIDYGALIAYAVSHPRELGLLLAVLDEYPGKAALITSILNVDVLAEGVRDMLVSDLERGDLAGFGMKFLVASCGVSAASMLLIAISPYLALVRSFKNSARIAIRIKSLLTKALSAMVARIAALASLKDFSHARLAMLEALSLSICRLPRVDLGVWSRTYGHEHYFQRIGIGSEPASISRLFEQAEGEVRSASTRVRQVFERAWTRDSQCSKEYAAPISFLTQATAALEALGV